MLHSPSKGTHIKLLYIMKGILVIIALCGQLFTFQPVDSGVMNGLNDCSGCECDCNNGILSNLKNKKVALWRFIFGLPDCDICCGCPSTSTSSVMSNRRRGPGNKNTVKPGSISNRGSTVGNGNNPENGLQPDSNQDNDQTPSPGQKCDFNSLNPGSGCGKTGCPHRTNCDNQGIGYDVGNTNSTVNNTNATTTRIQSINSPPANIVNNPSAVPVRTITTSKSHARSSTPVFPQSTTTTAASTIASGTRNDCYDSGNCISNMDYNLKTNGCYCGRGVICKECLDMYQYNSDTENRISRANSKRFNEPLNYY